MSKRFLLFLGVILIAFLFFLNASDCQGAPVYGTSTALTSSYPQNKVKANFSLPVLKLELNTTSTPAENLDSITVTLSTTTDATPTSTATSSFDWIGVFRDDNDNNQFDNNDHLVDTSTVSLAPSTTTINIPPGIAATNTFFVVLKTSNLWTDNNYPDVQSAMYQAVKVNIATDGVVASSTVASVNATETLPFIADTHSQTPDSTKISALYQGGNYSLFDTNQSGGVSEAGVLNIYSTSTGTILLATTTITANGNINVNIGSTYYPSLWLSVEDIIGNASSSLSQYNLPPLPTVTSIKAFTDRIIFKTSKNLRGDQAMDCSNYTISGYGSSLNCAGPGYPFIDFFGNQVVIKDLDLTSGSTISFSVSGIQDIDSDQFPLNYSTTTLLVETASIPTISSISPNSTSTGGTVVISGSNFGNATGTVLFSGGFSPTTGPLPPVQASTTAWSNSSITATVPTGANSGPVQVVTSEGITSDTNENSFFDVLTNVYFKLFLNSTSTEVTTSTNLRIFVGGPRGENVYYVNDSQGTSFDSSTHIWTIPNISSMGFAWAFDASGYYLSSSGREILSGNTTSTNPVQLIFPSTTTKKVSGTITLGSSCTADHQNKWVAVMAMPEGVETAMGPSGPQPSFFKTNNNCQTTYTLALPGNGIFQVESHLPPFSATSTPLLDPSSRTITISDSLPTTTVNFTFTAATRSIYGRVVGANGDPLDSQKYDELWVLLFSQKPKVNLMLLNLIIQDISDYTPLRVSIRLVLAGQ